MESIIQSKHISKDIENVIFCCNLKNCNLNHESFQRLHLNKRNANVNPNLRNYPMIFSLFETKGRRSVKLKIACGATASLTTLFSAVALGASSVEWVLFCERLLEKHFCLKAAENVVAFLFLFISFTHDVSNAPGIMTCVLAHLWWMIMIYRGSFD